MTTKRVIGLCVLLAAAVAPAASAGVCMNKYINHTDRARQIVTLLTGSITFEEAHALANHASAIEWVDEKGKPVAQAAEFHVIRPMPVGCEGKSSGVVAIATFLTLRAPTGTMYVKLGGGEAVPFTPQKE